MSLSPTTAASPPSSVGMGQVKLAAAPARLNAVLGSCVGVALYHPRARIGALGHVVLPRSGGTGGGPAKFAESAIPYMLAQLEQRGASRTALVARIAGGACMFGTGGPLQIGDQNVAAVLAALKASGVRVVAQDTGGTKGRRVSLDCTNGELTVEIVGCPPRIL